LFLVYDKFSNLYEGTKLALCVRYQIFEDVSINGGNAVRTEFFGDQSARIMQEFGSITQAQTVAGNIPIVTTFVAVRSKIFITLMFNRRDQLINQCIDTF
jgi:hypothetical protein